MKLHLLAVPTLVGAVLVSGCASGSIDPATRRTVEDSSGATSAMQANQWATDRANAQMANDQAAAASAGAANQAATDGAAAAAASAAAANQ